MAARTRFTPTIATRHHRQYRLGPGLERPIGRVVVVLLLVTLLAVLPLASSLAGLGPSEQAQRLAHLTPRQLLGEGTSHFLPTPIAALAPEANAGPPAPAAGESASEDYTAAGAEQVKVANTGGLGVLLRSDPPSGRLVASLRDGQVLEVREHQRVGDAEWLRVRTREGTEGWVFARLVGPAR
jgi:Bacterial SH3 domain